MVDFKGARRRRLVWRALCLVAVLILALVFRAKISYGLHELDQRFLNERIIDSIAQWRGDEDWASAEQLLRKQDYSWAQGSVGNPVLIAHALGESGSAQANTFAALERAMGRGFRHFEVDLWLEPTHVRCHHGPPGPPPFTVGDCDLAGLLARLPSDAWLILDIKTDFASTSERVLQIALQAGRTKRLVFQLYKPGHLALFNRWQAIYPDLPGPLITAYLAHRSIDHVAHHASRVGAKVLTVPRERVRAFTSRPAALTLFEHPIHDCQAWDGALADGALGLYQLNALQCASKALH